MINCRYPMQQRVGTPDNAATRVLDDVSWRRYPHSHLCEVAVLNFGDARWVPEGRHADGYVKGYHVAGSNDHRFSKRDADGSPIFTLRACPHGRRSKWAFGNETTVVPWPPSNAPLNRVMAASAASRTVRPVEVKALAPQEEIPS